MRQRKLGKTGLSVSEIAFGGVEIGLPYGIGVNDQSDMLSHSEAVSLLHAALEGGINFFDTARLYGESETIMGKAFFNRRKDVVIATKCKHFRDADGTIPAYSSLKKIIEGSLTESLAALQTDYVDVFMLHQADIQILENEDVRRVFLDLKESGRIRATGASTYAAEEAMLAIDSKAWDVIQLPFNLMDQRQQTVFSAAASQGVGLVIRSVLLKGLLSSKGRDLHPALHEVEAHIKKYRSLLDESTIDLPSLATKFALSFGEVSSVLVGIDRLNYLQESLRTADGVYFDEQKLAKAKALQYPDPSFLDLPKWDRLGWLK
ncbi:aldo/keto reductase [Flavisolibacter ginsenosidimutans]|uniref:Aldo/keto reductase n=1 Tax=Flavisolibacter ginsenosidimutans TaxID=661481 RepID=A0A5B8UDL2_9BACT|nr:aldo/keto reductase [Flavisolibacter ginsenosidimutans]QEC54386.1 aldo/keto reductase [Flavisolibacter ginsenosidimutans]